MKKYDKPGRRHKAKYHNIIRLMPGRRVRFRGNRQRKHNRDSKRRLEKILYG